MTSAIVFTFIGADKPGLIEKMSRLVNEHGGNWLESRMSQLAGQFAGIVRVTLPEENVAALRQALAKISNDELMIVVQTGQPKASATPCRPLRLSIIGGDRPGIVREVAGELLRHNINVREMNTQVTSTPMTAAPLFEAYADIEVPTTLAIADLHQRLDAIADRLTVDIALEAKE